MPPYSYARCLENAYKVNWRIEDVLGERRFDPAQRWLPRSLSSADAAACLDAHEKRLLTHVEMAAYAHLFGYVEEFIAPKMSALAADYALDQRTAFDALTNFAAEEVKHMTLFRRLRDRIHADMGFELARLGGETDTARFVLGKSDGAVLLFVAAIEWMTLRHYVEAIRDDDALDPFTKQVFHSHWLEESQHAQLDHLETLRAFAPLGPAERERAVDELIELVSAVDGLLQAQVAHDLENASRYLRRRFGPAELDELRGTLLRAKRWTFIETGVTHPRFTELLEEVATPAQQARVGDALATLLGNAPARAG